MKRNILAAVAAALAISSTAALATASASLTISGMSGIAGETGTDGSYWEAFGANLSDTVGPGKSVTQTFDYTVSFHDDGLAATRSWSGCEPIQNAYCGPGPTGFEQAVLHIAGSTVRNSNPFISFTFSPTVFLSATVGEDTTYSGSFSITETNDDTLAPWSSTGTVVASIWVDSSGITPVPEPSALSMCGIAALAFATRRRRTSRTHHLKR